MLAGMSSSRSLWLFRLCCCFCGYRSRMASFTSTTNMMVSFNLVRRRAVGVVLIGLAGSCCRDVDWSWSCYRGVDRNFFISFTMARQSWLLCLWHHVKMACFLFTPTLHGLAWNKSCCRDDEWHISMYRLAPPLPPPLIGVRLL